MSMERHLIISATTHYNFIVRCCTNRADVFNRVRMTLCSLVCYLALYPDRPNILRQDAPLPGRHLPFRARSECLCYRVLEPLVLVNTRSIDIEPTKHAHKIIEHVPANG